LITHERSRGKNTVCKSNPFKYGKYFRQFPLPGRKFSPEQSFLENFAHTKNNDYIFTKLIKLLNTKLRGFIGKGFGKIL